MAVNKEALKSILNKSINKWIWKVDN